MELTEKEMYNVTGGIGWAGIAYIIGVISGYTNPSKCNN